MAASNSINSTQTTFQTPLDLKPLNQHFLTPMVNQTWLKKPVDVPQTPVLHIANRLSNSIAEGDNVKALNHPFQDKADGYFSEVWESWGEDWDELTSDVKKTHQYLDKQDIRSSVIQQVGNVADFAVDLVGSLASNDKTKELANEAIDKLTQTDAYQSASKELAELTGETIQNINAYLDKNPAVKKALLQSAHAGMDATQAFMNNVKEIAKNHPEAVRNLGAVGEIIQVAGVGKLASVGIKGAGAVIKSGQSIVIKGLKRLGNGKVRVKLDGGNHIDVPEHVAYDNKGVYDPQSIKAHLETKYGKENVSSSTIPDNPKQASNTRNDVTIGDTGGKSVQIRGDEGGIKNIPYDNRVLPIFDDVAVYTTTIKKPINYANISEKARRSAEMRAATRQLRDDIESGKVDASQFTGKQLKQISAGLDRITGYTWHHNAQSSPNNMQLVPRDIHKIPHTGEGSMDR